MMNNNRTIPYLLTSLLLVACIPSITAQTSVKNDSVIARHLSNHAELLQKARASKDTLPRAVILDTIQTYFQKKNYLPAVTDTNFLQNYAIRINRKLEGENYLKINRFSYETGKDYYPLPQSGTGEIKSKLLDVNFGIHAPSMNYNDYKDFTTRELQDQAFLMRLSTPDGFNEQSPFKKYANIEAKTKEAISRGASAIIFSNLDPNLSAPAFNLNNITDTFNIPILYIKESHYRKLEYDYDYKTILKVSLQEILQQGKNFLAYRNKGADNTLIISSTYQPRDSSSKRTDINYRNNSLPIMMEWANLLMKDSLANSYNVLFALLPNDRTFNKGWLKMTSNDLLINDSSSTFHLAVDMPSSFYGSRKQINPKNINSRWEETITKIDSTIVFQGSSYQRNRSDLTAFYHADGYNTLHFSSTESSSSSTTLVKKGLNYLRVLNDTSSIADSLQKSASMIHSLFIPDYNYKEQGIRLYNVRNKQLQRNNIGKGTIIHKLNDEKINHFSSFLKRLEELNRNESIVLQLKNQSETFQIKIDHPFGTDTKY